MKRVGDSSPFSLFSQYNIDCESIKKAEQLDCSALKK